MKRTVKQLIFSAMVLPALPLMAQTTFFSDTFSSGSTLTNATPAIPTLDSASYQLVSTKGWSPPPSLTANDFKYGLASTSGGTIESEAVFTTNAVALTQIGDYIQIAVVFTNTTALLTASGQLDIGLFNSGGVNPIAGGLNGNATSSNTQLGGAVGWQGYNANIYFSGSNNRIQTRAAQTSTAANSQDLVTSGSGSESYANPAAAVIGTAVASTVALTTGSTYTELFTITLNGNSSVSITNTLFNGAGTGGSVVVQYGAIATNSTFITGGFDSFAIGWLAKAATTGGTVIDISSINITGQSTVPHGPPIIGTQPIPAVVATNGYGFFSVAATGFNVTYQWYRNGAALVNGGDISGATASTLVVSPAQASDIFSGSQGYYVAVTGTGPFTTNSVTNSLTLVRATNLLWTASSGNNWDVNTSLNWVDTNGNPQVFLGGDSVSFNDSANDSVVSLVGNVGPASISVTTAIQYTFQGSGSIVGPASVLLSGSGSPGSPGEVELNDSSTYFGGTTVTNAVYLLLENYGGFGTGPVNLADEGGTMEIASDGSATSGIIGPVNVAADYTIQIDGDGTFATVFLGDLDGTLGKTLTFSQQTSGTTNRYRLYGTNTSCSANIILQGNSTSEAQYIGTVMAPYNVNGFQFYNGIISGNGGLIQRGTGTTVLNAQNTYSGGTTPSTGAIGLEVDSTGSPTVTSGPIGTGYLLLAPEVPNTGGSGQIFAYGAAHTLANTITYPSITNNQTLIVGGTNPLTLSGQFMLNGLDGIAGTTNRVIQVTNTALTTISGVISDNGLGYSLTKNGPGTLALTATETYSGSTTVGAGTLLVNGQLASASTVSVTNGSLGGKGTIPNTVTVASGAILAPQNLGLGTLTINNTLTLAAGSTNMVQVSKTASAKDSVTVANVVYGGTLIATNIAGTLTTSDSFTIYNATTHSGNFTAIAGTPGPGLAWAFNPATGVLSVIAGVNTNPTNIVFSVSGTTLGLSWPADHIGWRLLVQTNHLTNGISTNINDWGTVAGSTTIDQTNITINPASPLEFYRLVYP